MKNLLAEDESVSRPFLELLTICSYCLRIRSGENGWQQAGADRADHSGAQLTHGVCPQCYESIVKPELQHLRA